MTSRALGGSDYPHGPDLQRCSSGVISNTGNARGTPALIGRGCWRGRGQEMDPLTLYWVQDPEKRVVEEDALLY